MKVLGACLALGVLLTPTRSVPLNSTGAVGRYAGLCQYERQQCSNAGGSFCPRCDANGNFLPQQCWSSTGFCWCVDIMTGVEVPNTQTGPGVKPEDCARGRHCPNGWSNYGKRCFIFIDTPKMWAEAEIYCRFEGANLASVHSYEENRFVMSLTRGQTHDFPQTWIGGIAPVLPGFWMWTDGSSFIYENWFHDHEDPVQTCLRMNHGYDFIWFYDSCSASFPFVCSKVM